MRMILSLVMASVFSGCALLPTDHVRIHPEFKKNQVNSIYVVKPGFPKKLKRKWPTDLQEMLKGNQAKTGAYVQYLFEALLASNRFLVVEAAYLSEETRKAAQDVANDLAVDRVPHSVKLPEVKEDAVLLVGIVEYGRYMTQWRVRMLPFLPWTKNHLLGKKKWQHICDLQVLLVNPRTGRILMDIRQEAKVLVYREDPKLLKQVVMEAVKKIVDAFPK